MNRLTTTSLRRCKHGASFALLAAIIAAAPAPLAAQRGAEVTAEKRFIPTVQYTPGSATTPGFSSASVEMEYLFFTCSNGSSTGLFVAVTLREGSLRPSSTYMFRGRSFSATTTPDALRFPRARAVVLYGGQPLGDTNLSTLVGTDPIEFNCREGHNNTSRLGELSRHVSNVSDPAAVRAFLNMLTLRFSSIPETLRDRGFEATLARQITAEEQALAATATKARQDLMALAQARAQARQDSINRVRAAASGANRTAAGGAVAASGAAASVAGVSRGTTGAAGSTSRSGASASSAPRTSTATAPAQPTAADREADRQLRERRRQDSIAAVYRERADSNAAYAARTKKAEGELVQAVGEFAALFQKSPEEIAREEERLRRANEDAARAYRERRMAKLAEVGARPACGGETNPDIQMGQTVSGTITGYECRVKDDASAVIYKFQLARKDIVRVNVTSSGFWEKHWISDRRGQLVRELDSRGEVELDAGTHYVAVATLNPGDTGNYTVRLRGGSRSIVGNMSITGFRYLDSYTADSAYMNGKSSQGGGFRLSLGILRYVQLYGVFGGGGSGPGKRVGSFGVDVMGGGVRAYGPSKRWKWRPFAEMTYAKVDGWAVTGPGTFDFETPDGFGQIYGFGIERFFSQRLGVEASYNSMNAELDPGAGGTPFAASMKRFQLAATAHIW